MSLHLPTKVIAIFLMCLFAQILFADSLGRHLYWRQDSPTLTIAPQTILDSEGPSVTPLITSSTGRDEFSSAVSDMESVTSSTSKLLAPSAVNSAMNGISTTSPTNETGNNYNLSSNDLPINPRITPGFALAGIILIISGAVYATTGIKNRWLQIYLSSAYLAGLATTVLILYVMNLPISNGTQVAYVVAVFATGAVVGAASILFSEITEGLGCMLGGFCLSMWLLVLQPSGLLAGKGRVTLIAALMVGGFTTSFSQYTRSYCLIGFISLGGATSIILGVDCFSRVGLKEFWAYLWALNPDLFLLEDTSYPLTRGMKVEIASILVISMAGIISQMKLWKVVQERRQKKVDEKLQITRRMEEADDDSAKQNIEKTREKDQWEVVYYDDDKNLPIPPEARAKYSKVMETGSGSAVLLLAQSRDVKKEISAVTNHQGLEGSNGGTIIVRVAQETDELQTDVRENFEITKGSEMKGEIWIISPDSEIRLDSRMSESSGHHSKRISTSAVSSGPIVVPLPFEIRESSESVKSDQSSIGAQATIGDETVEDVTQQSKYQSARLSILRKVSGETKATSRSENLIENHYPEFNLQVSGNHGPEVDTKISRNASLSISTSSLSVGATQNSFSPALDRSKTPFSEKEVDLVGAGQNDLDDCKDISNSNQTIEKPVNSRISESVVEEDKIEKLNESLSTKSTLSVIETGTASSAQFPKEKLQNSDKESKSKSSISNIQAKKIAEHSLSSHVSKVFMCYRTNEWAKHLEYAEKPEIEVLENLEFSHAEGESIEKPVPVRVQELQQIPKNPYFTTSSSTSKQLFNQPGIVTAESIVYNNPSTLNNHSRDMIITNTSQGSLVSQQSLVPSHRTNHTSIAPSTYNNIRFENPNDSRSTMIESLKGNNTSPQAQFSGIRASNSLLLNRNSSFARSKALYKRSSGLSIQEPSPASISQAGSSETGSVYNCPLLLEDDETMSLSQRRDLIRQATSASSPQSGIMSHQMTFNSNQQRRVSSLPKSQERQKQLAWWRASVRQDLRTSIPPQDRIEQQRIMLRENQKQDEMRRIVEERKKDAREEAWNEMMRSREMLDAHREALRRLQQKANEKIS